MPEYHIIWEIDVYADSPREAAERALAIHRNPESIATFFEVTDEAGTTERIDLEDCDDTNVGSETIMLTESDWAEIYYAVELKRLGVTEDNRQNGRVADGVNLVAWRRQMEHLADKLGTDGKRMHDALRELIEAADRVVSRWDQSDLQFAVQNLDRALKHFGIGTSRQTAQKHRGTARKSRKPLS
jgi:hypothetical protein